jgi:hypothetical protein
MKYYKVISNKLTPAFGGRYSKDNVYSFKLKRGVRYSWQYIADELMTPAEARNLYGITPENLHLFPFLQPVEVSKKKTHYFFGARFEDNRAVYFTKDGAPFDEKGALYGRR